MDKIENHMLVGEPQTPPKNEEEPIDERCPYCKTPTKDGKPCAECLMSIAEMREER